MTFYVWLNSQWRRHEKGSLLYAIATDLIHALDIPPELDSLAWLKHLIWRSNRESNSLLWVAEEVWNQYQQSLTEEQ